MTYSLALTPEAGGGSTGGMFLVAKNSTSTLTGQKGFGFLNNSGYGYLFRMDLATSVMTGFPSFGVSLPTGTPTYAVGTNVTSCAQATGYTNTNTRGEVTIVGGTATTGTICTVTFSAALTGTPVVQISQNGGTASYILGHGTATTTSFTITSGSSVAGATINIDYEVMP